MEKSDKNKSVRGVPEHLWRQLRLEAVQQDRTIGSLLTEYILAGLARARRSRQEGQGQR